MCLISLKSVKNARLRSFVMDASTAADAKADHHRETGKKNVCPDPADSKNRKLFPGRFVCRSEPDGAINQNPIKTFVTKSVFKRPIVGFDE